VARLESHKRSAALAPYQHTPIHKTDTNNQNRLNGVLSLPFAMSTYLPLDVRKCKTQTVPTRRRSHLIYRVGIVRFIE
jgi:hypothetical protein